MLFVVTFSIPEYKFVELLEEAHLSRISIRFEIAVAIIVHNFVLFYVFSELNVCNFNNYKYLPIRDAPSFFGREGEGVGWTVSKQNSCAAKTVKKNRASAFYHPIAH